MLPPDKPVRDSVTDRIFLFEDKTTTEAGIPPQIQVINVDQRYAAAAQVNFLLGNPADVATARVWGYDQFLGWGVIEEISLPGTFNPNFMIPWKNDICGMSVGVTISAFTSGGGGGGVSCTVGIFGRHSGGNF